MKSTGGNFLQYDPVFVGAVSSAALSCNLNFSLKKNHVEVMCAAIGLARACADKCSWTLSLRRCVTREGVQNWTMARWRVK